MPTRDDLRRTLEDRLRTLEGRARKLQADRRRAQGPLDRDSEEQALELENAEVVDVLDETGRSELLAVREALARLDDGSFGRCRGCGEAIAPARLEALPTATLCIDCASGSPG